MNNDTPIVVLKQNRSFLSGMMIFLVCLGIYAIFSDILPVIMARSYSAGSAGDESQFKQIFMFWGMLYAIPFIAYMTIMGVRLFGDFSFYPDRLEFQSFWFNRKVSLPYDKMYVEFGSLGIGITTAPMPSKWNPIDRFRVKYNSLFIPTGIFFDDNIVGGFKWGISKRWLNPQDGPKAIQILKEKTFQSQFIN